MLRQVVLLTLVILSSACGIAPSEPNLETPPIIEKPAAWQEQFDKIEKEATEQGGMAVSITDANQSVALSVDNVNSAIFGAGIKLEANSIAGISNESPAILRILPATASLSDSAFTLGGPAADFTVQDIDGKDISLLKQATLTLPLTGTHSNTPFVARIEGTAFSILEMQVVGQSSVSAVTPHLSIYAVVVRKGAPVYDANKPAIVYFGGTTTMVDGDTHFAMSIRVTSSTEVNSLTRSFSGPNGNIYGGGGTTSFEEVAPNTWETTWSDVVSKWAPDGVYTYDYISVENQARIESDTWPTPVTFLVQDGYTATAPSIVFAAVTTEAVVGGTELTLTVRASSDAPASTFSGSFYSPINNIWGGGGGAIFSEVTTGVWETVYTDFLSEWAPDGYYRYENLVVGNEGYFESDFWPNAVSVYVTSPLDAIQPVISYVNLVTSVTDGVVELTMTLRATSNAPVNSLMRCFDGPNGNIYGGGGTTDFTEISSGLWETSWQDTILAVEPDGDYTYSCLTVSNKGYLESEVWPDTITVVITR